MKPFIVLTLLLVATCSASLHGAISTQYQHIDPHSKTYSYGYADPNSQKHESRSHDGVTRGTYSYVDANGHIQSLSYIADPHSGFQAVGTNLPKGPDSIASYAPTHAYVPYNNIHLAAPIILTPAGVPVDTPEVQHAKAQHFAAHAAAAKDSLHHLYKRSLYGGPWAYAPAAHVPLTHGGVPVEPADVQAARAEHLAAHSKALGEVAHARGTPVETPEVQHAKAQHFAAHAAARVGHPIAPAQPIHGYHIPVIHNGVPVETPEVQHAKAAHYAALSEASSRASQGGYNDDGRYDGRYEGRYDGRNDGGYDGRWENDLGSKYSAKGPIHIPVIQNGVPVEPPEVQHARAAHLNALAAASHNAANSRHYGGSYEDDGQYRPQYNHY